jgi:hypothetical protein
MANLVTNKQVNVQYKGFIVAMICSSVTWLAEGNRRVRGAPSSTNHGKRNSLAEGQLLLIRLAIITAKP